MSALFRASRNRRDEVLLDRGPPGYLAGACYVRGAERVAVGLLRVAVTADDPRKIANRALLVDIQRVHAQHQERYGAPRIHVELRAAGQTVSRKRVERIMRQHGIRARAPRRYRVCATETARRDLFAYIEGYYNWRRIHSAIGYITPQQAEAKAA